MRLLYLTVLLGNFILISGEKVRYDNYHVYSINVESAKQLKVLQDLKNSHDGILFMETPISLGKPIDIVVSPHKFTNISALFNAYEIKNEIKIENLQTLIDAEQPEVLCSSFDWKQYHDTAAIYKWLDELIRRHRKILTDYTYGRSYENRPLRAVKLSHKAGNPTIFIESTIHAREWITVATATYILNELLTSRDAEIKALAKNFDWVFVPIVNVDGYEFAHTTNRLWRKNRNPYSDMWNCVGADLNRNFDFHHTEEGSSTDSCDETYAGPSSFSEPETLALSKFIKTFDNIKLYLSFHSYSQLLLFPYGHSTAVHATNHDDLYQIGQKTTQAIKRRYGTDYTTGNIAETIYLASGNSIDWVYAAHNVSLTYTFEFRDNGHFGFILPADQIIPNSLEVIDGLKAMINEAKLLQYL
ncbi:zinc carboxypeptidase-like [Sitodiplosis mosellana]|uniref:zinc carboxypeptidase-like n=1 Tax=Sitodiplosis mosellana TaxID=263140 RepID=UPI0024445685|nr:zinc carboxypeptidase-like [Sitodiplosis mosellana]